MAVNQLLLIIMITSTRQHAFKQYYIAAVDVPGERYNDFSIVLYHNVISHCIYACTLLLHA